MSKKPTLFFLTTSFPNDGHPYAGIFIRHECALHSSNFDIKLLCPHHPGAPTQEIKENVSIHRFRYFFPEKWQKVAYESGIPINLASSWVAKFQWPFFLVSFLVRAWQLRKKDDILYAHWMIAGLIGVLLKKWYGNPLVLMMHHAHEPSRIYRWILRHADHVLVNAPFVKEKTAKIFPHHNLSLVGVTIDPSFYRKISTKETLSLRSILKIDPTDFVCICIGRLIPLKGQEYLLRALKQLIIVHPNIKLILVGKGPLKSHLIKLCKELDINSYTRFIDQVENKELPVWYKMADVTIAPSIVDQEGETEGLGMTAIESLAAGTPIIASRVGGLGTHIVHEKNGLLIPPADPDALAEAIARILEDQALLQQFNNALDSVSERPQSYNVDLVHGIFSSLTRNY
jgi:glycosyltransferase involved in cell wall biosynthesis